MTLIQFLIALSTHICQVWQPDSAGLGNHIVMEGNCIDGFHLANVLHGLITWSIPSQ